jgi:hypothetical protein
MAYLKPEINGRSALVYDRELHDLVAALDEAAEILEAIGYPSAGANYLALSLRESFEVRHALEQAANFLAELRFCGGRP